VVLYPVIWLEANVTPFPTFQIIPFLSMSLHSSMLFHTDKYVDLGLVLRRLSLHKYLALDGLYP